MSKAISRIGWFLGGAAVGIGGVLALGYFLEEEGYTPLSSCSDDDASSDESGLSFTTSNTEDRGSNTPEETENTEATWTLP